VGGTNNQLDSVGRRVWGSVVSQQQGVFRNVKFGGIGDSRAGVCCVWLPRARSESGTGWGLGLGKSWGLGQNP